MPARRHAVLSLRGSGRPRRRGGSMAMAGKASGQSLKVTPLGVGGFVPADNSYCLGRGLVLAQDFTGWHVDDHVSVSLLWALSGLAHNLVLPHVIRRNFVQVRGVLIPRSARLGPGPLRRAVRRFARNIVSASL